MLNDNQIKKLRSLYKQCFGKEITDEEAQRQGAALLRLVDLIYKPMTETELKQIKKYGKNNNKANPNGNGNDTRTIKK